MPAIFSLLAAPLFQNEWHGIALTEIAAMVGLPKERLADHDFYGVFYRELRKRGYPLSEGWLAIKGEASTRVRAMLNAVDPLWREHGRVALAVGAGLGVVEIPLIADGYRIHLQECQPESLHYFQERSPVAAEKIYSPSNLADIPTGSYDAVYLTHVVYALKLKNYREMLAEIFRILRPGGALAIWDPECRLTGFRDWIWHPHSGIFWGWERSRWLHLALAREAGFSLMHQADLSIRHVPLNIGVKRILGCTLPGSPAVEQELVFTKPD